MHFRRPCEQPPYPAPASGGGRDHGDGVAEAGALTLAAISLRDWLSDPRRWAQLVSDLALDGKVDDSGAKQVLTQMLHACEAALT